MYIHYSSTDDYASPPQETSDQKAQTPIPQSREYKVISRLTNSLAKKESDKAYMFTPRIQTDRYLQEFQPKIMGMMSNKKEMSQHKEYKFYKKTAFAPLNMEKYRIELISILNSERMS